MPDDDELVAQILHGSQAAMEVLVRRHYRGVHAFICRRIGDQQAAYDITQDVFARVLTSLSSYAGPGKFANWVFTIAVNRCRDFIRAAEVTRGHLSPAGMPEDLHDEKANVWDLFERRLRDDRIQTALRTLPDTQREAILLSYFHGYRMREIGVMTGVSESTVKSRVRQGLAKLRSQLQEGGDVAREQDG